MSDDLTPAESFPGSSLSAPTTYWFAGVEYTATDRAALVERLLADPDLIAAYEESALKSLRGFFGWGAFDEAKEWFGVMCDVLADVAERQGKRVRR